MSDNLRARLSAMLGFDGDASNGAIVRRVAVLVEERTLTTDRLGLGDGATDEAIASAVAKLQATTMALQDALQGQRERVAELRAEVERLESVEDMLTSSQTRLGATLERLNHARDQRDAYRTALHFATGRDHA